MKYNYFILFLIQILNVRSPIPNWDITQQANILDVSSSSMDYTIYDKTAYNIRVVLKKEISKSGTKIVIQNDLFVYDSYGIQKAQFYVKFEDIDSHYTGKLGYNILICPKGKFHPFKIYGNSYINAPPGFEDKGGWDLRCFDHNTGYFYIFYLLNNGKNFYYKYNGGINEKSEYIYSYFYDYIFENGSDEYTQYKFCVLRYDGANDGVIRLIPEALLTNKTVGDVNKETKGSPKDINSAKNKVQAYFSIDKYLFYFTYNNASDFESGYSTSKISFNSESDFSSSVSNIVIQKNTESPLTFADNVEIKEMNFIPGTKYVYYKIHSNSKNTNYFGLLDIVENKILYNFEAEFKKFIPALTSSTIVMLGITDTDAYQICIIKSSCLNECSRTNLILDDEGNKCQARCGTGKIKLMPEGYCIKRESCDLNIYELNSDSTECGLCKYFNSNNDAQYKFINTRGCISITSLPTNAEYYNENSKLLQCKTDHHLNSGECVPDFCFERCLTCSSASNNITNQKCLTCNSGYILDEETGNCEESPTTIIIPPTTVITTSCIYNYYFDNDNKIHCTNNNICPKEYPILEDRECKKGNKLNIEDLMENINNIKIKEGEIKNDNILKIIEDFYTSKNFDTSNIDNGKDEIIDIEKMKIIFSSTENQKRNIDKNTINLDFGECENSIRKSYNLKNEDIIYIKMYEIFQEGMRIPKIEYDLYSKLNGDILIKLNLNSCQNDETIISIPVDTTDSIDKLNSSSGYYNDFCYTTISDKGTDITLKERKKQYPSKAVCQDDCKFINYNYTSKKSKCLCKPKGSSSSFIDMIINKKKLIDNFKNIKNIANLKLLKCYRVLFSKKGISKNVGFFIFIAFLIFHTITLIIFYLKKLDLLIKKIKQLIYAIKYVKLKTFEEKKESDEKIENHEEIKEKESKNKKTGEIESNQIKFIKINNNIINENINNINKEIIEDDTKIKLKKKRKKKKSNKRNKKEKSINFDTKQNLININLNNNNIIADGNYKKIFEDNSKIDDNKNIISIIGYTDKEINDLSYDSALKNDKRSYWQIYISLIKSKHKLIYVFCYNKDYNPTIIKIDLFLLRFSLNYTVNGLFFSDDTMSKVYEDGGLFNISYQIPISVYSSFISMILGTLIEMLGLTNDEIISLKQNEETNYINQKGKKLIKILKIKFILYFILGYILLLFFWYYISMFDAVYINTQYLLLEDTLISLGFSLIYPFLIYLIPGLLRIPALTDPQKNKKCLYICSKLVMML